MSKLSKVTLKELDEKFEGLKLVLKNIKSNKTGGDLYQHLQEVFKTLIMHYPNNALEKIEEVSYLIKNKGDIDIDKYLKTSDLRNHRGVCELMKEYCTYMTAQFPQPPVVNPDDEDPGEPEPTEPINYVPDMAEEATLW